MDKLTFELENINYEIPNIMSIGDYVKIFKVKDLFEDEYLKAKVVNLLTNCPMETLLSAENHKVEFLATSIFSMIPRPPYNLIDRFELDGIHYGYIPSYKEMSFAEFVDLDTLLTKKPEEIMEYLHIITAIMYRPIVSEKKKHDFKIEKYDSEKMIERSELFKEKLDVKFALGGQFFFINFVNNSSNYIRLSLKQKIWMRWILIKFFVKNWRKIWKLLSKKDSVGMSSLIESQITKLKITTKS
jgi:hypothetical protein